MTAWIVTTPRETAEDVGAYCYRAGRQNDADPTFPSDDHDRPAEWVTLQVDKPASARGTPGSILVGYYYEVGTDSIAQSSPIFDTFGGVPADVMGEFPDRYRLGGVADEPLFGPDD